VLVKYAQEHAVPLIARGAGTGLAGESLGPGLVVDLSVSFRAIVAIEADQVTVQPGVTHADLNTALTRHGRRFAPDPASSVACTVGGMVANNASGSNAVRYGYTRDHVRALRTVWDNGEADALGRDTAPASDRLVELRVQTAALLAENREIIKQTRPAT